MEDKLLELKEQYCKWYCQNRGKILDYRCTGTVECEECEQIIECNQIQEIYFDYCKECNALNFIKFIRDELGGI